MTVHLFFPERRGDERPGRADPDPDLGRFDRDLPLRRPIGEYDASGNILSRYAPGPDEAVLWYQGPGTVNASWLYGDQQGSTIAWSDGAGNGQGTQAYDPFGQPQSWSGPRYAYTGQLMLPQAQLYDYKARAYDPALGRFLQTDPAGYASDINPYAYVFNGPMGAIDPTGLISAAIGWNARPIAPRRPRR